MGKKHTEETEGTIGRPMTFLEPLLPNGLHPFQADWLKERAKSDGVPVARALRRVLWDAMEADGQDVANEKAIDSPKA